MNLYMWMVETQAGFLKMITSNKFFNRTEDCLDLIQEKKILPHNAQAA